MLNIVKTLPLLGFRQLNRLTKSLALVSIFFLAVLLIAGKIFVYPESFSRGLISEEIELLKHDTDNRWNVLEQSLEISRIPYSIEQENNVKREIVRYFEDVLYQNSGDLDEFRVLRARREILGKDQNFTLAGEALYDLFDESERITKAVIKSYIARRPVGIPHVEFNENLSNEENYELAGKLFLLALAEGSEAKETIHSEFTKIPTGLFNKDQQVITPIPTFLADKKLVHSMPPTERTQSYDLIYHGDCVQDYYQSEKCTDGNKPPYYYVTEDWRSITSEGKERQGRARPSNEAPDQPPSPKPWNGGTSYARLDGYPWQGGVLVGRLPEGSSSPIEISDIKWSDNEDGNIRLSLQLPDDNESVEIGLFRKDILNLALQFVADGRPALVTIIPDQYTTKPEIFLHPVLQNTFLGCEVISLDTLVDRLYGNRSELEIDGMNLVSQVRVEPYTLGDGYHFMKGPENPDVNPTWPFYFTLYYLKQLERFEDIDTHLEHASEAREHSLKLRNEITDTVHQTLRRGGIDEELFIDLRQFVVAQRVFRLAFLGYFGNQFPVEHLIRLARHTEGSVKRVKTRTRLEGDDECPGFFSRMWIPVHQRETEQDWF